ncbi:MAG TPA: tetratricopeptide repeat protein [Nitrospiria bacterium]|nr:tetratricopeptide repeat protein [Nitrospiria bacterium]
MAVDRSTLIQNAQRFTARGQIDKAIEEWQKLVSQTPQDGNLYNTIGDLYLKKNDNHHAVETFLLAAAAFERAGFALKTIAVYKKILKVDPSNLEVNLKLADLNADRGLTGNAIEDYLKVAKEFGRAGKVHQALDIYRKIANFDPSNINIHLKLAELSLREKLTDEAIDEYTKIAKIYEQNGRSADAAGMYKKILDINPKHEAAREALKLSGPKEALKEPAPKGTLKESAPTAAPVLPTIKEIEDAIASEDWDLAGQKASALLLHEPSNMTLRWLRGKVLLHNGHRKAAWDDYRAIVDEAMRARRVDEAITLVREYIGQAPDQREAVEWLASQYEERKQVPEAVQTLATLIELMDREGVHESEVKECFLKMKALDPAGEMTGRYMARFEPPPVQEAVEPVVAGPVQVEPGTSDPRGTEVDRLDDAGSAPVEAGQAAGEAPVTGEVSDGNKDGWSDALAHILPGSLPAEPVPDEGELPAVEDAPPAPVESSKSSRSHSVSHSVSHRAAATPDKLSANAPPSREASQSQSQERSAPSISHRAAAEPVKPAARPPHRAEASQSQSREPSAPPKQKKRVRPRDLQDYFAEAEVYLKYGLAAKAIEQYDLILSIDPNNIEAHSKLSELYQLEGRTEEAVTHCVALAQVYLAGGQRDAAEQIWGEARELSPDDPRLQGGITDHDAPATPHATQHEDDQLPQEETIQRPKHDLQEWLAEAEFYLQQGLQEQAHELFETIRQHYPDAPEIQAYFSAPHQSVQGGARASAAKGMSEVADEPERSSGDDPPSENDASLSKQLADLFPGAFRGMTDEIPQNAADRLTASVEGVIKAVEQGGQPLPPEGPDPHYSLGLAYKEMGLYSEARKEFEQALSVPTCRIDAALMIAACHGAEGQSKLAVRHLQQFLDALNHDDPKWAEVAYETARMYADTGEPDKAVTLLQSVIRTNSAHEQAASLLKTLQKPSPSNGSQERERSQPSPSVKAAPEDRGHRSDDPADKAGEPKNDKNKRRRISYV